MWTIAADMLEAAEKLKIFVGALTTETAAGIRESANKKFGRSGRWPLWDGPGDDPSFQEEQAWQAIPDFIGNVDCIIFWEPRTEQKALRFRSGRDLVAVLEECHRTEFYVTDDDLSYLFCFNEHDFLVGWGNAATWVAQRRDTPGTRGYPTQK